MLSVLAAASGRVSVHLNLWRWLLLLVWLCSTKLRFPPRFPSGPEAEVDAAAQHIAALFLACNRNADKPLYHHFTTATDTTNVQVVFHMVAHQLVRQSLADVQLL